MLKSAKKASTNLRHKTYIHTCNYTIHQQKIDRTNTKFNKTLYQSKTQSPCNQNKTQYKKKSATRMDINNESHVHP